MDCAALEVQAVRRARLREPKIDGDSGEMKVDMKLFVQFLYGES